MIHTDTTSEISGGYDEQTVYACLEAFSLLRAREIQYYHLIQPVVVEQTVTSRLSLKRLMDSQNDSDNEAAKSDNNIKEAAHYAARKEAGLHCCNHTKNDYPQISSCSSGKDRVVSLTNQPLDTLKYTGKMIAQDPPLYKGPPDLPPNPLDIRAKISPRVRPPTPPLPGTTDYWDHSELRKISSLPINQPSSSKPVESIQKEVLEPKIPNLSQAQRLHKLKCSVSGNSSNERTQAWIQESKTYSKPVSEKLCTLQQRLRSFLHHGASDAKKTEDRKQKEMEKTDKVDGSNLIKDTYKDLPKSGVDNPGLIASPQELRPERSNAHPNRLPTENCEYLSFPSAQYRRSPNTTKDTHSISVRHTSGLDSEQSQDEDITRDDLRHACNRLYSRDQRIYWNTFFMNKHSYLTHGLRSVTENVESASVEKFGRLPSDTRKTDVKCIKNTTVNQESFHRCGSEEEMTRSSRSNNQPLFVKEKTKKAQSPVITNSSYLRRNYVENNTENSNNESSTVKDVKETVQKISPAVDLRVKVGSSNQIPLSVRQTQPSRTAQDAETGSEKYKSSSESGRGTLRSGVVSSKGPVSENTASAVDTSIDSDQSVDGVSWQAKPKSTPCGDPSSKEHLSCRTKINDMTEWTNVMVNKKKWVPQPTSFSRREVESNKYSAHVLDGTCSESTCLSITPPLPPLSPSPESPTFSSRVSPQVSFKMKSKMSSSLVCGRREPTDGGNATMSANTKVLVDKSTSVSGKKLFTKKMITRRPASATNVGRSRQSNQRSRLVTSFVHPVENQNKRKNAQYSNSGMTSTRPTNTLIRPRGKKTASAKLNNLTSYFDTADTEITSTTTGVDIDSLLEEPDDYSSERSATTSSNFESSEVAMVRKQLEGLEAMYLEILHLLGVNSSHQQRYLSAPFCGSCSNYSRTSKRRVHGSLSSLTGRSSVSRGTHSSRDRRRNDHRKRSKEQNIAGAAGKRFKRLESHVVTLARGVAHLSSEMRSHHVLVQELETLRRDVNWLQEQFNALDAAAGGTTKQFDGKAAGNSHSSNSRKWKKFTTDFLELMNPDRVQKLTKFFGDEPPLMREFLKKLGYENYASNFEAEKIGAMEMPYITEDKLQKIGIPMGPRMRILQEVQNPPPKDRLKVYIV
ncbi:uncharacterized protein LOC143226066 isoform X2 [Tachypleus tridentatus]|uniref:uncharacterized protein LOC143226066 isoform X2 n=1 Tax=Tachypleus tridentatus TaxID=6853 RepID=UPI003FD20A95